MRLRRASDLDPAYVRSSLQHDPCRRRHTAAMLRDVAEKGALSLSLDSYMSAAQGHADADTHEA